MANPSISQLFDLSEQAALVTGGALGIGQAIAFRLAEAGAGVVIVDIDLAAAQDTASQIEQRGGRARAVRADVCRAEEVDAAVRATVDAFGRLDILVNNAGIFPLLPVLDVTEETWDRVLDINLKGAFLFAKAAAQQMAQAGRGGRIINLASVDALHPNGMATPYNASKGGVLMLTKGLALELAMHGILVNAVAPGGITTPGADAARAHVSDAMRVPDDAILQGWIQRVPLRRMGEPDDVAKVVLFLASRAADFITGEWIVVDGGYLLS
jgi:2-deoxy-D-gluconate 3-dehydrogenase